MKRIVKLTESDLTRIVRRVMNEGIMIGCMPEKFKQKQTVTAELSQDGKDIIITLANNERCTVKPQGGIE